MSSLSLFNATSRVSRVSSIPRSPFCPPSTVSNNSSTASLASLALSDTSSDTSTSSLGDDLVLLSQLLSLPGDVGHEPLTWSAGGIYDVIAPTTSLPVVKLLDALQRLDCVALDGRFFRAQLDRIERLVAQLSRCPAAHALAALAYFTLGEPHGALEHVRCARILARLQLGPRDSIDERFERSVELQLLTLDARFGQERKIYAGHDDPVYGTSDSRCYYTPFTPLAPIDKLSPIERSMWQQMAALLHEEWQALEVGDGGRVDRSRRQLVRLFGIQDGLVEKIFAITTDSIASLVQAVHLNPSDISIQRTSAITSRTEALEVIRCHNEAYSMIARLSRDVDGLTIDRLNTIHLVLTGGQRFDHSSPQPVLLRRGALRAMLSSTHLSPIEGQSQRAVQIHAEPWVIRHEYQRLLDLLTAELEQLRCPVRALQLSIWVQHAVLAIRPYQSGNGQISRLIGALPLLRVGLPPTFLCLNVAGQNAQILTKMAVDGPKSAEGLLPLARNLVLSTAYAIRYVGRVRTHAIGSSVFNDMR